jgi:hypothetical protein
VGVFGFVPLAPGLLMALVGITVLYVVATELQKRWFFWKNQPAAN